jgi:hypothetical protein
MDSIQSNPLARDLLLSDRHRVRTEVTVTASVSAFDVDGSLLTATFRSRLDYLRPTVVVDLKTTRDGSIERWPWLADKLGYHMQAWAYRQMAGMLDDLEREVYFVVVENCEPYRCDVWRCTDTTLARGRSALEAAVEDYLRRAAVGDWTRDYFGDVLEF